MENLITFFIFSKSLPVISALPIYDGIFHQKFDFFYLTVSCTTCLLQKVNKSAKMVSLLAKIIFMSKWAPAEMIGKELEDIKNVR
jgi:hypothetical protein